MKEVKSSRNGVFFCFVLLLFSKLSEASGYKQKSPSNRYSFGSSEHWRGLFSICKYKELRSLWGEEQAGPLWPGRLISPALLVCRAGFLGHGPLCLSIKMPPGKSKRWTPDSVYLELQKAWNGPSQGPQAAKGTFPWGKGSLGWLGTHRTEMTPAQPNGGGFDMKKLLPAKRSWWSLGKPYRKIIKIWQWLINWVF